MTAEALIWYLIVMAVTGLIVGAIARLLIPGPTPMSILGTIGAGIGGALLGGIVGRLLFGPTYAPGLIASVLGALAIVALVTRGRRPVRYY